MFHPWPAQSHFAIWHLPWDRWIRSPGSCRDLQRSASFSHGSPHCWNPWENPKGNTTGGSHHWGSANGKAGKMTWKADFRGHWTDLWLTESLFVFWWEKAPPANRNWWNVGEALRNWVGWDFKNVGKKCFIVWFRSVGKDLPKLVSLRKTLVRNVFWKTGFFGLGSGCPLSIIWCWFPVPPNTYI